MGQPARILDLAEKMIRLAGYEPRVDIDIVFTGSRRGERLNEILFSGNEPVVDIGVDGVMAAQTSPVERAAMTRWLAELAARWKEAIGPLPNAFTARRFPIFAARLRSPISPPVAPRSGSQTASDRGARSNTKALRRAAAPLRRMGRSA